MSSHDETEFQILLDKASNYIVTHASAAGLDVLPPVWDGGSPSMATPIHHVRIATRDGNINLAVPRDWLFLDSDGHNRFRTQVETVLAELRRRRQPTHSG